MSEVKRPKKKRGRPATGQGKALSGRVPRPLHEQFLKWVADNKTTRSHAIRLAVEYFLEKHSINNNRRR